MPKFVALWVALTATFAFPAIAAPEENIAIATLLRVAGRSPATQEQPVGVHLIPASGWAVSRAMP
jgi:hypothetical protein